MIYSTMRKVLLFVLIALGTAGAILAVGNMLGCGKQGASNMAGAMVQLTAEQEQTVRSPETLTVELDGLGELEGLESLTLEITIAKQTIDQTDADAEDGGGGAGLVKMGSDPLQRSGSGDDSESETSSEVESETSGPTTRPAP